MRWPDENTALKFQYTSGEARDRNIALGIPVACELENMYKRAVRDTPAEGSSDKIMKEDDKLIQAITCIFNLNVM